ADGPAPRPGSGIRPRSGGGAVRDAADRALETRAIEPEAVPREQLRQVVPGVGARPRHVLDAVAQDAVPVTVVAAEARDVLAHRAERLAEVRGRRIVGLEAREDLSAAEEVGRVVVEMAVLVDEVVDVARPPVALGVPG